MAALLKRKHVAETFEQLTKSSTSTNYCDSFFREYSERDFKVKTAVFI